MTNIKKGDQFRAYYSSEIYEIVGKWNGNLVLASTTPGSDECLMYLPEEIEGMVSEGQWERTSAN